jgi:hypothetical protein
MKLGEKHEIVWYSFNWFSQEKEKFEILLNSLRRQ